MGVPLHEIRRTAMAPSPNLARGLSWRPEGAAMPLSTAQRLLWPDASFASPAPLPNETVTIHRSGSLDEAALKAALNALVQRHEALRTSFGMEGAEPVQIIHPHAALSILAADVTHLPEADRDAAAIAIAATDTARPIDLASAPAMRVRVIHMAEDDHRLVLIIHPILLDTASLQRTLLPELARLYAVFAAGEPSPLPEPSIGYGDYTLWQSERLKEGERRRQMTYWRGALANAPPRFDLVGDRPRPALPGRAGSVETCLVPLPLMRTLEQLAAAREATLPMAMLAAFTALLHRRSGEQDIVIGGIADLRRHPDLHQVVGNFRNIVALRTCPSPDLPFESHLAQVRTMASAALDTADVPFGDVLRALRLPNDMSSPPLFSILFSIALPADPAPTGWDIGPIETDGGGARFDLHLALERRPEGMVARFRYSPQLFDSATIRGLRDQWLTMLDGIAAAPAAALGVLPLMTDDEAHRIAAWNATGRTWPEQTLIELIAAQARRTPDATAVTHEGQSWDYRTLDRRTSEIAAGLAAAGIGSGSLVAVALDRSPELVATLLGIWRAGAAYLPLDARQPRARLARIIANSAPDLLLTQRDLVDALPVDGLPVLLADRPIDALPAPRPASPKADDLAYVIYTSGSTGLPKGVEITHRALANFIRTMQERPGFSAADSILAVTAVTFDIAVLELFLPLASGGRVVIASHQASREPARLLALIAAERPSMIQATPATWLALLEAGWRGDPDLTCLCGGEAMSRALAERLLDRCATLWNMYGPTEATVWATAERVGRGEWPVSIGKPIGNMTAHILDAADRPVPRGIVGELHLGGAGLARGYRGQAMLTRDRFPTVAGERLYRTGDLARRRSDGALIWLGRIDHEEKIRGYRVAVEEVEGALTALPEVAAAAVRGWPDASGVRTLVAYVVRASEARQAPADLRRRLASTLPDYMVPGRFVFLDALPMTASGKIDRGALGAPVAAELQPDRDPPAGPQEERLARLWCEVLGLDTFDRTDSFFDLGGHSLLAAHLLRRIEQEYHRRIDLAELFRVQRFDAMVTALATRPHDPDLVVPIQPLGSQPALFWLDGGPAQIELARLLGDDHPFLGIPIRAMAEAKPDLGFADLARDVIRRIRTVQPHGPYRVGGWCTAGILAFEVARQLCASGQEVPLLVMGDSTDPTWRGGPLRRIRYHLRRLAAGPNEGRTRYMIGQIRKGLAWWSGFDAAPFVPAEEDAALDEAASHYLPQSYAGTVLLFRSSDWDARLGQGGWRRHIRGRIIDRVFPGDHETFFHPGKIDGFAALLRKMLTNLAR